MNTKLLQNHIDIAFASIIVPLLASDGSNAVDFYCSDVVGNKRFAQNYGCYPRSEIAEINAQANQQLQLSMLAQLNDYSSSVDNDNAGRTDAELMLSHRSKYVQQPSEMQRWLEGQLEIRDARRASQSAPSSEEGAIDFNKGDDNNGAE